ncbi:MAG TPA: hypothetical protein EYP33_00610, partial [Pyrodictium sp.]|nr:hypothetical protein [Pyrodictium sp.]
MRAWTLCPGFNEWRGGIHPDNSYRITCAFSDRLAPNPARLTIQLAPYSNGDTDMEAAKNAARPAGSATVAEYLEAAGFDVFENANRYPGPSGLLTYVA